MNLAKRVRSLERIRGTEPIRRLVVRYENPETGVLEPTDAVIDENTRVLIVHYVPSPFRNEQAPGFRDEDRPPV